MLLALLSSSCAPRTAPAPAASPAPIQTDRARYVLRPGSIADEATIVATFTAPKDTTLQILHCNGAISWGLQRLIEDRWTDVWVATTNGCLSPPKIVPAGAVHAETLVVYSRKIDPPRPGTVQEEILPGTYRVVWFNVLTGSDPRARPLGQELSLENRVSKPITIERVP